MKLTEAFKRNNEDNLMKRKITKILLLTRFFPKRLKITKEERNKKREKRNELQLIIERSRTIRFNYIVNREKPAKIFFGSTLHRKTLPIKEAKYMSPLMRKITSTLVKCPDPTTYYLDTTLIKNYPNRLGYTLLASKVPRMYIIDSSITPPVGSYDVDPMKPIKENKVPFGVKAKFKDTKLLTPGPYNFFKKTIRVNDSFGGKRTLIPAVRVICTPLNDAQCKACGQLPYGDYWRNFRTKEDLCRPCMKFQMDELKACATIRTVAKIRKLAELKTYERARYCDFYHKHSGTKAALPVMTKNVLKKKLNKENYLAMFNM